MSEERPAGAEWQVTAPPAFAIEPLPAPPEVLALRLAGEIDVATSEALRERVNAAVGAKARALVLDMADVVFMDSSTLRELIRARSLLGEGGGVVVLAAAQPAVRRLLELTGTTELFVQAATREDALAAAGAASA